MIRVLIISAMVLCIGCSQRTFNAVSYGDDDMYGTLTESYIAQRQQAREEALKRAVEQRRAEWSTQLGFADSGLVKYDPKIYDTPYGRRLIALNSGEYYRPDSYYTLEYKESVLDALQSYDPAIYDATVDSDGTIFVEAKYSPSIYGVWSAPLPYYYGYYPSYPSYSYSYGYPYWGYGLYYDHLYTSFYTPFCRPIIPYRPMPVYYRSAPKIVSTPQGYTTGKRMSNGATVGTSTRTTTNRGFSSSPSTPSPSGGGGGGGTNALGR